MLKIVCSAITYVPQKVFLGDGTVCTLPSCISSNLTFCRNFIFENQEQLVQNEEQFVSSFVRKSREHYACLFDAHDSALKFSDASVDHTVRGFVGEVHNLN